MPDDESTILNEVLRPAGVSPASLSRVEMTEAIVEMAKAGIGIGVLSNWSVAPHVAAGTLRAVPLTRSRFGRTWSAAALKRTAGLPHIRDFVNILIEAQPFGMPIAATKRPSRKIGARKPSAANRRVA